jgi:hypothetical protein
VKNTLRECINLPAATEGEIRLPGQDTQANRIQRIFSWVRPRRRSGPNRYIPSKIDKSTAKSAGLSFFGTAWPQN